MSETKSIEVSNKVAQAERWVYVDRFCPSCGNKDVWQNQPVNPSTNPDHLCTACSAAFSQSASVEQDDSDVMKQRIKALA